MHESPAIRVILADDHHLVRQGIRALLEKTEDIVVVGEAEDGHKALQWVEWVAPDVVVVDMAMPRLNGLQTIAQIQGVAVGGGCAIALACDLRICTPDSQLGMPIAKTLGNCLSAANHARIMDLVGPARLKELLFTGRLLSADEAAVLGLVNRIVDAETIDAAVREQAAAIAANAPLTIRATKEMVRRIQAARRLQAGEAHDLIELCYTSEDFREGIAAFLAKRPPSWKGR